MATTDDRAGQTIAGRYELIERLPLSAAPEAWRGRRLQDGSPVLIFYYPDAKLSGAVAQRFLREAPYAQGIEHTRLVPIVDVGVDPDGAAFAVSPLAEGETLATRLAREGRVPFTEAVPVLCDALAGLGALHERNLVHRCITSAEVVTYREPGGRLRGKLLLGGLVGVLAHVAGEGVRARGDMARAYGSPRYLAPEQCRGDQATPETDVWAVGVVLYESLVGAVPFDGATAAEVIRAVLLDSPPLMFDAMPDVIAEVIEQALEKRAADRFTDAEAFCLILTSAYEKCRHSAPPIPPRTAPPQAIAASLPPTAVAPTGVAGEFAADDLDALVAGVKSEASPPTNFDLDFTAPGASPNAFAPPPMSFDLGLDEPASDALAGGVPPPPAGVVMNPNPIIPSLQPPAVAVPPRDSETHTALSAQVVDRSQAPIVRRNRPLSAGVALVGVAVVTGGLGYVGWQLTMNERPHVEDPSLNPHRPPRRPRLVRTRGADASVRGDAAVAHAGGGGDDDDAPNAREPRPEIQAPAQTGEQLNVNIPEVVSPDTLPQYINHVVTAALPDAATTPGFATCADGRVFVHPGGISGAIRMAQVGARCEGQDIALVPDLDGDRAPEVVAIDTLRTGLMVVSSRNLRVAWRVPVPGAWGLASGLAVAQEARASGRDHGSRGGRHGRPRHGREDTPSDAGRPPVPTEPAVVVFTLPEGGTAALVAVQIKNGRVVWRTDAALRPGDPREHGLAVGPDLDGDALPDVVAGLRDDARRCVTALSGATGAPLWPQPRCYDGTALQSVALGPDLDEDGRGEVAVGSAADARVRILSGADGQEFRVIQPAEPQDGTTFGLGIALVPDVAHDGFPDVILVRAHPSASAAEIYSANDTHRVTSRPVVLHGAPVAANQLRVQYAESFAFQGGRSVLIASPSGISIVGASPRPEGPASGGL